MSHVGNYAQQTDRLLKLGGEEGPTQRLIGTAPRFDAIELAQRSAGKPNRGHEARERM